MHDAARLRYLRDCYREDHRSQAILDVFASKIEARRVLDPENVETLDNVPRGDSLAREARLHRAEKSLLLGRLFVVGSVPEGDGRAAICAPLWLTPVEVEADDEGRARLRPAWERTHSNHPLLSLLADLHGTEPDTLERFERRLPEPDADAASLARWLRVAFEGLLVDEPPTSEPITDARALRDLLRKVRRRQVPEGATRIEPREGAVLLLVHQSIDTRGVSFELGELADRAEKDGEAGLSTPLSAPLRALLGGRVPPTADRPIEEIGAQVPAILSPPQLRALENAARETLSLVIGPPGTGKSFTIAALALDALARGESVLVASKTDAAVDVVAQKVTALLGRSDAVVRGGRREYARELKAALDDLLHGSVAPEDAEGPSDDELRRLENEIGVLGEALSRRSADEIRWGELEAALEGAAGWRPVDRLGRWWLERRLRRARPYWEEMARYRGGLEEQIRQRGEALRARSRRRLDRLMSEHRQTLRRLASSLRARTVERRGRLWDEIDAGVLLRALPIWMVRLSDVSRVLPLEPGLFDLVVIDEATQCDLASSVPLLERGQRAVIVGDPKQLRHLSFLARSRQQRLGERHGLGRDEVEALDYRDQSVLDRVDALLESQDHVARLDEHFRSVPSIITFSNREFYGDRLRVMQEHPAHDYRRSLYLHHVTGERRPDGANPSEAEALVDAVARAIEASQPEDLPPSIGVLSPFRAQVEILGDLLAERLDERAMSRHDLRVGTPYAFQGDERDAMYLSLALDAASHPSALRYLERPDVFNVAVTRARNRQEVFVSLGVDDALLDSHSGLLRRFLLHMRSDGLSPAPRSVDDPFLVEVRTRLELEGFRTWPAYSIAGLEVDLVIERRGECLGIDLVGAPGAFAGSFPLERYRLFNRAGLRLFPLPLSAWRADPGACVAAIERVIGS